METNTWYSIQGDASYDEVFYELQEVLEQRKWIVVSYQNLSEVRAQTGAIFPAGLEPNTNTEIIVTHRGVEGDKSRSEVGPTVPVVITEFEGGSMVATVSKNSFQSQSTNSSKQDSEMLWEELTAIIDDATENVS